MHSSPMLLRCQGTTPEVHSMGLVDSEILSFDHSSAFSLYSTSLSLENVLCSCLVLTAVRFTISASYRKSIPCSHN